MTENNLENRIAELEKQVILINERNLKVQFDKAWETSNFRIICVCLLTWIVVSLVFWTIGVDDSMINAIIPTTGFYLSTQSLPFLKKWWLENNQSRES